MAHGLVDGRRREGGDPGRWRLAPLTLAVATCWALAPPRGLAQGPGEAREARRYPWPRRSARYEPLARRVPPPAGFRRVAASPGSFGAWLRGLPLLPPGSPVRARDGGVLVAGDDPRLAAVVDLDVMRAQQCWDTALRLRAEWLRASGRSRAMAFPYGGGLRRLRWRDWAAGMRPVRQGRRLVLRPGGRAGAGRRVFESYLRHLFARTGTIHAHLLRRVAPEALRPGDVLVRPGSPGHAVVVLDVAEDGRGRRVALLGQGFMPAQDLHVLAVSGALSPWVPVGGPSERVSVPFYGPMSWGELRRWP